MGKDLAEKEREFIDALAADTGRDLAGWMAAIGESGANGRNAIIDWLRQQGFAFPKASWLERIHHNGGKLVYADDSAIALVQQRLGAGARSKPAAPREAAVKSSADVGPAADLESESSTIVVNASIAENSEEVTLLLAGAKGLRPLAELILREIADIIPGTRHTIETPFIIMASPAEFAALLPQPKDIRLYADFGGDARDRTQKADAGRIRAPFPDMLVLNDARQIDERFRDLLAKAYSRSLA